MVCRQIKGNLKEELDADLPKMTEELLAHTWSTFAAGGPSMAHVLNGVHATVLFLMGYHYT